MTDVENRAKAIFLAAVDRDTPEERAAVLAERCGDDAALRRRVEALLRAHDQPGNVLGTPRRVRKPRSSRRNRPRSRRSSPAVTGSSNGSAKAAWARSGSPSRRNRSSVAWR